MHRDGFASQQKNNNVVGRLYANTIKRNNRKTKTEKDTPCKHSHLPRKVTGRKRILILSLGARKAGDFNFILPFFSVLF